MKPLPIINTCSPHQATITEWQVIFTLLKAFFLKIRSYAWPDESLLKSKLWLRICIDLHVRFMMAVKEAHGNSGRDAEMNISGGRFLHRTTINCEVHNFDLNDVIILKNNL